QIISAGNLTLTLTNPTAVANVVGSSYDDDITGNSRDGFLIGAGGKNRITVGTGSQLVQGGITQVVLLDFDTATVFGEHVYTQDERDAIQHELEQIYADFHFVFTQDPAVARQVSQPTGGRYATIYFNTPPRGGLSSEVDFRNINLGGVASVDVTPILGTAGEP